MTQTCYFFGVDYYPEHWPESRWLVDARMMGEAKFNVVRLAEFSWCKLEPKPGVYDFSWLDDALNVLEGHGLKAVLGTPTAAPPPWLVKMHPDILPVDYRGHPMPPVARRHYCPNNPNYRRATERIVKALAEHYKGDERVIGYQVDNELSMGDEYCYCEHCVNLFRGWLRGKYGGLEELNRAYGTVFWSQEYGDWSEVHPPTPPFDLCNRSLALDWFRFKSKSLVDYLELQVKILKSISPEKFVTTNLPGALHSSVDCFEMGYKLDFMSWDCYPRFAGGSEPASTSLQHDAARVMSGGGRFWVMELQAGPTDGYFSYPIGLSPEPGELRKWAYQALARGAEGILYFNWRTIHFGKEQFWHGILNHDGEVNRRYLEVKKLGRELENVMRELGGSSFNSEVAVMFSYESLWATLIEKGYYHVDYYSQIFTTYRELWKLGINVDVIPPDAELSKYKIVFTPFLYLTSKALTSKIKEYVSNGGVVVSTARTSVKDEHNNVYVTGLPGGLTDLFGIRVTDYTPVPPTAQANVEVQGLKVPAQAWLEELQPSTANVIGFHEYSWLKAKPAVTLNKHGRGYALYVGSFLTPRLAQEVVKLALKLNQVKPPVEVEGDSVEVALRERGGCKFLFLINHEAVERKVTLKLPQASKAKSLLSDLVWVGREFVVTLGPHDVEILKLSTDAQA